jgi:hypothetical protein
LTSSFTRVAIGRAVSGKTEEPTEFRLYQNFPNPFNPTTSIRFDLPVEGIVTIKVYDLLDRELAVLVNRERVTSGSHSVEFRGDNLPSGVYFYRISVETTAEPTSGTSRRQYSEMKKMVMIR